MREPMQTESDEAEGTGRSARKRRAILNAATEFFLQNGFLGTSMDEVAQRAEVSKQTVYKHFANKEALFIAIVSGMTVAAGDRVLSKISDPKENEDPAVYLQAYAERQLTVVLTPKLMQLRRLVIGEAARFPDLGKALYQGGPKRAIQNLASVFKLLAARGVLIIDDPLAAASNFNWLVMGEPVNKAMLLGDKAIPNAAAIRRHAVECARVFLAAYGARR
jgi:TetR/AcrR family transcriptional regulator, mexJK operon transcriptional repressor